MRHDGYCAARLRRPSQSATYRQIRPSGGGTPDLISGRVRPPATSAIRARDNAPRLTSATTCHCAKIFAEKISGARADNRKELAKVLKALAAGDTLIVTRLDRLARSTRDLLNTLDAVAKAGAAFKSLADTWADTTTPHGKLMLTVLGGLAEFERTLIRSRTDEGRKRALAAGIRFGRKPKLTPYQRQETQERLEAGES